ncbi:MAG: L-serine ammonia-lyase, iron-sulfur-dependent, subunit alpha [Lentisphaerota bacterium]
MKSFAGSIFEVFKVGAGPSSSHSMGPQRAAQIFLDRLTIKPASIRVTLYGSLSATGPGHLTDQAIKTALSPIPCEFVWDDTTTLLQHPNTMKFEAVHATGEILRSWTVFSIGGGNLSDEHGPVGIVDPVQYPIKNITEAIGYCMANNLVFWQLIEKTEHNVWPRLDKIWKVMRDGIQRGLESAPSMLPGSLKLKRRAPTTWAQAQKLNSPHRDIAFLSAFAMAVAEENANGGAVVTAPTCGSSGVLPGLLYYYETIKGETRENILRALATAGFFGAVIQKNASVSGAEAGCQAEIGSACSMAAAAGSQLLGGSLAQIEYAAEMGMEHHLGLTCDPVEGYVQIPCIERNMTACLRAFECASFSILTDGQHLVSFDDVIDVMYRTGNDLQSAYRETARGGLALLWRKRIGQENAIPAQGKPPALAQC